MKVFVADLDGTLLNEMHELPKETEDLVHLVRSKGYHFGIATGRPYSSAVSTIPHLKTLFDFAVFENGGEVHDYRTGEIHNQFPLSGEKVKEIIKIGRHCNGNAILTQGEIMYVDKLDAYTDIVSAFMDVRKVDMLEVVKEIHPKIIFSGTPEILECIAEYDREHPDPSYQVFKSQVDLIEFMDPRVNKCVGIEWYLNRHGISLQEVMSFGDNDNDISMVAGTGMGVAMKNATANVKAVADYVTDTNGNNGVYKFIVEFMSR
ncbi:HAD family phosphatase [Erysipelothrix sp. HDW6C]|uniref:Cof-type HAD-IIB family hydrolase n=1 Tax=Erysipelothrix sp. HDW6C TaxID=2714930 RepID=UPI00140770CF|nr:Cof-type HAD-IIB family hydrolase [Erysipelothrix sp. HDW6C]QIK70552.1 HAD family phosphatase [Erysipelothrix sp. HDW6C]